jgi:hypothetical protein
MSWERIGRKRSRTEVLSQHLSGRIKGNQKENTQDYRCTGRESKRAPPEHESRVSPYATLLRCTNLQRSEDLITEETHDLQCLIDLLTGRHPDEQNIVSPKERNQDQRGFSPSPGTQKLAVLRIRG